ncbi:MAG: hypothetical protein GF398_20710 [Chitinivibrionales bacterium]|nr:hypothetical protein [Chitinivibrionales bacterium]
MTKSYLGILIGGLIPAILFGISGVCQKAATRAGISLPPYILFISLGVMTGTAFAWLLIPEIKVNLKSGGFAAVIGLLWAIGMTLVGFALMRYNVPISKLAPLYNMNTLVAVVLSMLIFAEWKEVNPYTLITGALLIIIGGTLVANS